VRWTRGMKSEPTAAERVPLQATRPSSMKMARGSRFLRHLLVGLDAGALALSWVVATTVAPTTGRSALTSFVSTVAFVAVGLVVFGAAGLYRGRVCVLRMVEYEHVAKGCVIVGLLALAFEAVAVPGRVTPGQIALSSSCAFVCVIVLRSGYRAWLTNQRRMGHHLRSVLLVGTGNECSGIAALLKEHPELGYQPVGVVGDEIDAINHGLSDSWCGELDDGLEVLAETGGTGAIICAGDLRSSQLNQIVQALLRAGLHVQMSSGLQGVDIGRLRPSPLAHEPFFYVEHVTLASWQLVAKRAIDIVLSSTLLILVLPVLALAALGIKLQDLGPALFKQSRVGRQGAPFVLYKLRTMREGAESESVELLGFNTREGPLTKFRRDPRVTVLGRILRTTSVDELPQLWNVLNGTMSLVGPRPALPNEVALFDVELRARESVRPGITGLWQVEGRDNPSFAVYRRFDLFYVQNWSVTLDLMILLATAESVIARALRASPRLDEGSRLPALPTPNPAVRRRITVVKGTDPGVWHRDPDVRQDTIVRRVAQ
jgi:exopolysaccharide biosynthesis polyprenyl glycosylphosphotransferase